VIIKKLGFNLVGTNIEEPGSFNKILFGTLVKFYSGLIEV
jgi:hypothetical protein